MITSKKNKKTVIDNSIETKIRKIRELPQEVKDKFILISEEACEKVMRREPLTREEEFSIDVFLVTLNEY